MGSMLSNRGLPEMLATVIFLMTYVGVQMSRIITQLFLLICPGATINSSAMLLNGPCGET
jgi:hypothetical protein